MLTQPKQQLLLLFYLLKGIHPHNFIFTRDRINHLITKEKKYTIKMSENRQTTLPQASIFITFSVVCFKQDIFCKRHSLAYV